jgi:hypothetical protein
MLVRHDKSEPHGNARLTMQAPRDAHRPDSFAAL